MAATCSIDSFNAGSKPTSLRLETLSGAVGRRAIPDKIFRLCDYQVGDIVTVFIGGTIETNTLWKRFAAELEKEKLPYVALALPGQDGDKKHETQFTAEQIITGLKLSLQQLPELLNTKNVRMHVVGHSLGATSAVVLAADKLKSDSSISVEQLTLLAPAFETYERQRIQIPKNVFNAFGKDACLAFAETLPKLLTYLGNVSVERYRKISPDESEAARQELLFHSALPSKDICEAIDISVQARKDLPLVSSKAHAVFASKDGLVKEPDWLPKMMLKTTIGGGHLIPLNEEGMAIIQLVIDFAVRRRKSSGTAPAR